MKKTTFLFATALLAAAGVAQGRDLAPDEAAKLHQAGTILPLDRLEATALSKHPGATIADKELEREHGRYVYQLELRDTQGQEWELELDAASGKILKDRRD